MNVKDFDNAKEIYRRGGCTCVLARGESVLKLNRRGIEPLLRAAESGEYEGCCAADKIVGKAAALLYARLKAKAVYAEVISAAAVSVLNKYKIICEYGGLAPYISNRTGDGVCPMEQAVSGCDSPEQAVAALNAEIAKLKADKI